MPTDDHLLRLANDVSLGRTPDWDAERDRTRDAPERRVVDALATIARIAGAARSTTRADTIAFDGHLLPEMSYWGSYLVVSRVRRDPLGDVYLAVDRARRRDVALRLVDRSHPDVAAIRARAETWLGAGHENVVGVIAVESHDDRIGIVTEYLSGRTLASMLDRSVRESLPAASADDVQHALRSAIAFARETGREIGVPGTDDVWIEPDGRVVVTCVLGAPADGVTGSRVVDDAVRRLTSRVGGGTPVTGRGHGALARVRRWIGRRPGRA